MSTDMAHVPLPVRALGRVALLVDVLTIAFRGERLTGLPKWHLALLVVIIAGSKEWLYRGDAIERLRAMTGSPWLAGGISLAAFGLVHLPMWRWCRGFLRS